MSFFWSHFHWAVFFYTCSPVLTGSTGICLSFPFFYWYLASDSSGAAFFSMTLVHRSAHHSFGRHGSLFVFLFPLALAFFCSHSFVFNWAPVNGPVIHFPLFMRGTCLYRNWYMTRTALHHTLYVNYFQIAFRNGRLSLIPIAITQ